MGKIYVVGLGYGDPGALTLRAWNIIQTQKQIFLRTSRHPVVDFLREKGIQLRSFDQYYHRYDSFPEVYQAIVNELLLAGAQGEIVYAVPGDPALAENTVTLLREGAVRRAIPIEVVPGVSFIEPILSSLNLGQGEQLQISDAQVPGEIDPLRSHLFHQVWSKIIAGELKLRLLDFYPPEHTVTLLRSAGLAGEQKEALPLWQIDHLGWIDHLTSLYVPALSPCHAGPHFRGLENIMAYLRSERGCPWDRAQNHKSLIPYLLEEAYELADAIKLEDPNKICEEMGDLLLQIVFHGQIAAEKGQFTTGDAIRAITEKLVRRHPHAFGGESAETTAEVTGIWQRVKEGEGETAAAPDFPGLLGMEKHLAKDRELPRDPLLADLAQLVLKARAQGRNLEAEITFWLKGTRKS
jgi:tetrapyrrole methylase family protein/MazG family protein